ncbi:hypothetical protein ACFXP1_15910 [Streptomyces sp. NPDC059112]
MTRPAGRQTWAPDLEDKVVLVLLQTENELLKDLLPNPGHLRSV